MQAAAAGKPLSHNHNHHSNLYNTGYSSQKDPSKEALQNLELASARTTSGPPTRSGSVVDRGSGALTSPDDTSFLQTRYVGSRDTVTSQMSVFALFAILDF